MPIHERVCNQCEEKFETITIRASDEDEVECPKCGSKDLRKMPGYMGLYEIKGNNNASTPSRKRHRQSAD